MTYHFKNLKWCKGTGSYHWFDIPKEDPNGIHMFAGKDDVKKDFYWGICIGETEIMSGSERTLSQAKAICKIELCNYLYNLCCHLEEKIKP